ncbi:FAD-dependent oxidoreductase [Frigidibacter sp. MR17.14]|uniref:oxidoreductase n=1 Tax=Frigidibacter sp. MR17.14 TaxID=3126509 RepID=UPI003012C253
MTASPRYPLAARPLSLRGRRLRARVYLPAHQPGLAEGGAPGERYIAYHRARAAAGLGMQITGATPVVASEVWADGKTLVNVDDGIIPGYRRLAAAVQGEGGLMLAQLAHVGAMETAGDHIVSASWDRSELTQRMSRAASAEELGWITGRFAASARRCREGDLDGVEVSLAHGMLLASFLSPAMNRREDGYGGALAARCRYPLEVLAAVRGALGEDRILGIRMPGDEFLTGGIDPEEAGRIAVEIAGSGLVDYISVTGGNNLRKLARIDHWPPTPAPFAIFRTAAAAVRRALTAAGHADLPVATVGRVTSIALAEEILAAGDADLVGMVRANVADPRILPLSQEGREAEVRPCIGANVCINSLMAHETLTCMASPALGRAPAQAAAARLPEGSTVAVIGAGPAGLEAARRVALAGGRAVIFERTEAIGGQMARWADTPSRREFLKLIGWWRAEIDRLGIELRLGQPADPVAVAALRPAQVLLATGSRPVFVPVPGDGPSQCGPWDAAVDPPRAEGHAVVLDRFGRLAGMLTAERLAAAGWGRVSYVTSSLHPGEGEGITTAYALLRSLARAGIAVTDRAEPVALEPRRLILRGVFDEPRAAIEAVDLIVHLDRTLSETSAEAALTAAGLPVTRIGDAKLPRGVTEAVADAAATVWDLAAPGRAAAE